MNINISIFLPLLAAGIAVICKYILFKVEYQDLRLTGMPSGHAAAFGALITFLFLSKSDPKLLCVAATIVIAYLFDIWRMHYFITKDKKEIDLGHSVEEIVAGLIIGFLTVYIYSKYYSLSK